MPVVRLDAVGRAARLHRGSGDIRRQLRRHGGSGPVMVMIHGFKYCPGLIAHCPHRHIMALHPLDTPWRAPSWPRQLGFGTGHKGEGLAIAFGWDARGALWQARRNAVAAGHALAGVLADLHAEAPNRPVHILAHSMGIELALEAMHHLPAGSIDRVISMTGAAYRSRAEAALATLAGQACDFINVTSRENDLFDFMYERLIAPPRRGDVAIGQALAAPNAVSLQLDCAATLDFLDRQGVPLGGPERRICHWSSYTRPGVLRFYNQLLRAPDRWSLERLRQGVPDRQAPRWSRLMALPEISLPLPMPQKAS